MQIDFVPITVINGHVCFVGYCEHIIQTGIPASWIEDIPRLKKGFDNAKTESQDQR